MWIKIRDLIKSVAKKSVDYDEKYIKIKFYSDDELPLNKTIEIAAMLIVLRAIFFFFFFFENCHQVFDLIASMKYE